MSECNKHEGQMIKIWNGKDCGQWYFYIYVLYKLKVWGGLLK